jgi:endonuclease/exonuclease/phosphatase (EEP) superfamily protein YafD
MPDKRKPRRKPLSYLDAQDKVINLRAIYQTQAFGSADRAQTIARQQHRDLDEVATPEPNEELEDSELSDSERQAAIARERTRREGRA